VWIVAVLIAWTVVSVPIAIVVGRSIAKGGVGQPAQPVGATLVPLS
jgi:hypothetical protein